MSRQLQYAAIQAEKLSREAAAVDIACAILLRRQGRIVHSGEPECCICMDKLADCIILPCGHNTFCYGCLREYKRMSAVWRCPLCRGVIQQIVQ